MQQLLDRFTADIYAGCAMAEQPHNLVAAMERLLQISRDMVATTNLDDLLGLIIQRSMELLDAERATLFLYDAATDELISRIAHGEGEIRFSAGSGIAGAVVRQRAALNIPDAYADTRFNREVDLKTGFRTRNLLALPLLDHAGSLVGVLEVLNKRSGHFGDFEVGLAETLAAQAGVILQRAWLLEQFAAKQRMEQSLAIARQIQQDLLPRQQPQVAGFDIAGWSRPADETGGDIYDFMDLGGGRWMFMLADATGHGIGPALVIAEARAMLRALVSSEFTGHSSQSREGAAPLGTRNSELGPILARVNDLLVADLNSSRFVTCLFAVLDGPAAAVRLVSAGQGPILFYRAADDSFEELPATALPLGVMEGEDFSGQLTRPLAAGDIMVAITDGFFEAADAAGEQFGMERVRQVVRANCARPAAELIDLLRQAVETFTGHVGQADDLTAIVIKRVPSS